MAGETGRILGNHLPGGSERVAAANVLRRFSFLRFSKPAARSALASAAAYAEALLAGWVPPLPEIRARIDPGGRAVDEKSDGAAFLARVYLNQQC